MKKQPQITLKGKTREEKKVIISQDIIANVNAQVYIASKGSYVNNVYDIHSNVINTLDNLKPVKENWGDIKKCTVCALGACLMSVTKFNNRLNFNELPAGTRWYGKHLNLLTEIFTAAELAKIEVAFEGLWDEDESNIGRDKLNAKLSEKTVEKTINFHDLYTTDESRLVGIMQHIIDHKGKIAW